MVWQLDDELWFPDPRWGEDDGLVAIGGDLSVERLLLAYSNGFFPWYAFQMESESHWYCPLDRYVIFPHEIHISHSMRQLLRQQNSQSLAEGKSRYEVTFNQDFQGVIQGCSKAQGRNEESGAWLGPDIIEAYTRLHHRGFAVSVEVWEPTDNAAGRRLVGGLYGVALRNAFFGESMFSLVPNASKLALVHLAKAMERTGGRFIDCQFETPLFKSLGGRHITYEEYMTLMSESAKG